MALSRIWTAFIIISVCVAAYHWLFRGNDIIFSRMITGKSGDTYTYVMQGAYNGDTSAEGKNVFVNKVKAFGFVKKDSLSDAKYLVTDNPGADTVQRLKKQFPGLTVYTYRHVEKLSQRPVDGIFETCNSAVTIAISLIGIMTLFMGFMNIAERAGGIRFLSRIIGPFFSRLFPDLPRGHPAMGQMMMNFSANLLGLDNAATPFGIKAMESLQELNPIKDRASNAQIMFLCLHASGLTLIPITIIGDRIALKASNPTDIFIPCMIATFVATIAAMMVVSIKQRINIFQPVILAWIAGISAIIALLVYYITTMDPGRVQVFSGVLGNGILLLIIFLIVAGAAYKKINIFEAFIEGAIGGFQTAVRIIPYLVGLLVAISMLRSSGTFDAIIDGLKSVFGALGVDTKFVDGLPTGLLKPLSGSGARAMMIDTMKSTGPDSFASRVAGIMRGSSDTTFYIIAVYFGAVGIKNTRYSVGAMLLADFVAIVTSIVLAYLFFGNVRL